MKDYVTKEVTESISTYLKSVGIKDTTLLCEALMAMLKDEEDSKKDSQ